MTQQSKKQEAPQVTSSVEMVELTVKVPATMSISGYFPKDASDTFREAHAGMKHSLDMAKVAAQPAALAYLLERGLAHSRDAATPAATGDNKKLSLVDRHVLGNDGIAQRLAGFEKGEIPAGGGRGSSISSTLRYMRDLLVKQVSSAADRKIARALKSTDDCKAWFKGVIARQYGDDTAKAETAFTHKWDMLYGMVQRRVEEDALLMMELPDVERENGAEEGEEEAESEEEEA